MRKTMMMMRKMVRPRKRPGKSGIPGCRIDELDLTRPRHNIGPIEELHAGCAGKLSKRVVIRTEYNTNMRDQ